MAELPPITIARFWSKVRVGHPHQCWEWTGGVSDAGYGRFKIAGKLESPHRLAWQLVNGPIPESEDYHGTVVMHVCDNSRCCNPAHLQLGTQADNVLDMDIKGRRNMPRGEEQARAVLSAAQVAEIRASQESSRTLAARYNVSRWTIRDIRSGRTWQHIQLQTESQPGVG